MSSTFPNMVEVRQHFDAPAAIDHKKVLYDELGAADLKSIVRPGARVAIAVGSRGIKNIPDIVRTIAEEIRKAGGQPFIVPSMGSQGGATSAGQTRILHHLGVKEDYVGAPIEASMEVKEMGRLDNGMPVYVSKAAVSADAIIVVARVKPHTDFKDEIESGLMKMMVIGLGKRKGAQTFHTYGLDAYHKLLVPTARKIMETCPIRLGVAIVENQYYETVVVRALKPHEIEDEEKKLLVKAKEWMMTIPFSQLDLLIVEEIGKNISGTGFDPNVTGRFAHPQERPKGAPDVRLIVALDLTEESEGNSIGIGKADITTRRLFEKINFHHFYTNALSAGTTSIPDARIPPIMPTDREAIQTALQLLNKRNDDIRAMRIRNTLQLSRFEVSAAMIDEVERNGRLEVTGDLNEMQFSIVGDLV